MSDAPTVVFLCPHNALRSIIAAALFNRIAGGKLRGVSAGTEPDERVNERTVAVMREIGIDVTAVEPRLVSREELVKADRVISLDCPLGPELAAAASGKIEEWPMPDTSGKPVAAVREVRDLIDARVRTLVAELRALRASA